MNGAPGHTDWLGSSRLTSTATTPTSANFTAAYAPFGEQYAQAGASDFSFTGQNTSTTGNLYDFTFRRLSPSQGRWISPDPAGLGAAMIANPQTWNRYAYVLNNPNSLVDPLGLDPAVCNQSAGAQNVCPDDGGGGGAGSDITFVVNVVAYDVNVVANDLIGWMFYGGIDWNGNGPVNGTGPAGAGGAANNGPSWWGAFGKSLFSWKNFSAGFKPGGCFAQFAEEAFDPAADIAGQDAAIKATAQSGAYVAATAYAAQQGLVVPMRSSIVRGILDFGEFAGEAAALVPTIYEEGKALNNEIKSFANGECQ